MFNFRANSQRRGLFGGGALPEDAERDDRFSSLAAIGQRFEPQQQEQPRGLLGGLRQRVLGERDGTNFQDRVMMAGMALQGDGRGAAGYRQGLQEQQSAEAERARMLGEQARAAEQERQRIYGQAQALGMDPREFSMLPEATRNELFNRQYTPEEQEPNLREFGGSMYDFSDPQNPRMVMRGQQPRQDVETVVIDGRLVNRRTGEMIADYSDPNETGHDLTEQQAKFGMLTDIARNSNRILDDVEFGEDGEAGTEDDFEFNRGSATVASMQNSEVPVVGGLIRGAGEMIAAPDTRRAYDAYMGLTEAYLRATTGAQAPQAEIDRAMSQIVPRPGDSQAVRVDKQRRRREWQSAIERAAGPGARSQSEEIIEIDF
jgi:hypothetical protein